jgi:alkylated DNA repair dioxygenase AlkB
MGRVTTRRPDDTEPDPAAELRVDRHAPPERRELGPRSWAEVIPGFVRQPERTFAEIDNLADWRQAEVLRYDHYVPERRLSSALRASDHPALRQTELHLRSRFRVPFTGVAAILYRDGHDFQGLHSDREMRWLDNTLIAIAVLGARRPFVLRRRAEGGVPVERVAAGSQADDIVLTPGEGDLLIMGGACQREWLHGVPMADTDRPRISLTWRWTSRRGRPDTNPTYYDGRHFSDGDRRAGSRSRPR